MNNYNNVLELIKKGIIICIYTVFNVLMFSSRLPMCYLTKILKNLVSEVKEIIITHSTEKTNTPISDAISQGHKTDERRSMSLIQAY